jgi:flagellar biosynthesis protein FlhF
MGAMQYFTVQASSHREALDRVKSQYGEQARILNHRTVRLGGFLGFFAREGIEVTGYLSGDPVPAKRKAVDIEEEKKKILSSVKNEQTLQLLLKEVQSLKEKMDSPRPASDRAETHPNLARIQAILADNEFTTAYSQLLLDHLRQTLSLGDLDDFDKVQEAVVDWVGETISIHRIRASEKPYVFILVGPTGVGKTTTIAKLAALYGVSSPKQQKVRIITIDNYRIGAKEQIETYGEIMEIPVVCAQSTDELRKYLDLYNDVDLVFVDTIGKSPRDFMKLAEMRKLLDAVKSEGKVHLAVSATTKPADIVEIMQHFESFQYESVIVTKLDETSRVGNIISVLYEKRKPLSFFTDGQSVPQDIEKASINQLLIRIQGLKIRRDYIEKKFPDGRE